MWKILFVSILYSQSEVKASVASNLEPFLVGASQGAFIGNGGYYWKEFKNSSKALYAYEGPDLSSSLFFPNLFHHEVHGKVVVFECGGGYSNTAIQIYGKGYLYCGNYNGTPSTEQMFHTFDESNGRISMQILDLNINITKSSLIATKKGNLMYKIIKTSNSLLEHMKIPITGKYQSKKKIKKFIQTQQYQTC